MARVLVLDNIDSFTFNLAQAFEYLGAEVAVHRAATIVTAAHTFSPTHLVLSPGPKRPVDHPMNAVLLAQFAGRMPVLGVCLGMQAINEWCGGTLRHDRQPMHGKTSLVHYASGASLLDRLPNPFIVARYHSLVIDRLGNGLRATAWVDDATKTIMAVRHINWPLFGVQFHPESYLTPQGEQILATFLEGTFPDL